MRVLVTGASGFIGRWTLAPLQELGFEVHATGRHLPNKPHNHNVSAFHPADLLDPAQLRSLVAAVRPTHILHCAWEVTHGRFWTAPENLDWVAATLELARAFAAQGGRRFVGIGTCAEYDWSDGGAAARRESDTLRPATLYGEAKAATAAILQSYFAGEGIGFAWARLFHLFGPAEAPQRLVSSVARALLAGQRAECGSGHFVRDFMPVEMLGAALAKLVHSQVEGPVNVASGRGVSVEEIAKTLAALAQRPELIALGVRPDAPDAPRAMLADTTRLRDEIGFAASYDLKAALAAALDYWRTQGVTAA